MTDPVAPAAPQSQQTSEQAFIRQMFPKRFDAPAAPAPGAAPGAAPASPGSAGAPGASSGASDPAARPDGAPDAAQQQKQDGAPVEYAISDELAKFELPTEAGVPVKINPNDPRLPDARLAAKELGLSQAEFDRALKLDAHLTAKAVARANKQIDAAIASLGPTFEQERVAVVQWADTHLSPAEASELVNWFSHGNLAVKFKMIQRLSGLKPGAMHNNNDPKPPPQPQPQGDSLAHSLFPKRFDAAGNLLTRTR